MSYGPVELLVVSFPGNQFTGEIVPALEELIETGTIDLVEIDPGSLTVEAEAFVNGSSMGITPVDPMQWIFFLSPTYGYTCSGSQLNLTIPPLAVPVVLGREG